MSIQDFLLWLASGLGSSAIMSYIMERLEWFQNLVSDKKRLYATVGASVISILSFLTLKYVPAEVWDLLSPYWQLVLGVIAVNYGVEVFHFFDKKLLK